MAVLAIDTSAAIAVAVVSDGGEPLAQICIDERRRHAEQLAPMLSQVLADAGIDRFDLTGVVVGTGPAPFTGLRAGLVTAKSFAFALGIPVWGVPSIDALAQQAVTDLGLDDGAELLVATDARRREVYWARYRVLGQTVESLEGPAVAKPSELAGTADVVIVGEGGQMYSDHLRLTDGAPLLPDPAVLARLAATRLAAGQDLPTEPLYLRRPDINEARTAAAR